MASSYLKALQLTKQLEKKAQEATHNRKLAEEEITAAEELIIEAKKMDVNVAKAEAKLTEATSALSQKEFKSALENAKESCEQAKKAQQNHVFLVIDSTRKLVKLAQRQGIKTPDLDENLKNADSAIKENKYEEALETAKKSWEEVDKLLNEQVSEAFTKAQSLIVLAKKVDQDVSEAETLLNKAREHTDKSDYEKALTFINECMRLTRKMTKEVVVKLIENAMVSLELAKKMQGDIKTSDELYNNAKTSLKDGEYETAITLANQSLSETEEILKKQSKNLINQCDDGIKIAKNINAEVTKATLLYNKAKEALESKNFEEVLDYSDQIKGEIENAQFQCVLKTISLSRPKFITAKNIGADLSDSMKFLDMARGSLKEKKFQEALDFARKGEHSVTRLIKDYEGAKEELLRVAQTFSRASKLGVDTATINDSMKEAKSAFEAKDFKKAMDLITKCREGAGQAMYNHALKIVETSEAMIIIGEKTASDITKVKEILNQSVAAIKANDYERAIEFADKANKEADEGIKIGITNELRSLIVIVKSLPDGEEKKKSLNALSNAKRTLDLGNYEGAYKHTVDCKNIVEEYIATSIEVANSTVATLKEMQGDSEDSDKKLNKVKSLSEEKKYLEALSLSEKVIQEVNKQQQKIISDQFTNLNNDIQLAKDSGVDASEQIIKLGEAREAIGRKFYKKAYTLMTQSKDEMKTLLGQFKEFSESIGFLKSRIEEATKNNIDMSVALKKLQAAEKALSAQDFKTVSKTIEECQSEVEQLTTVNTIKKKMVDSKTCIEIAKGLGTDTNDVEMQLKKTVIYLNNGQLENATDSADKTLGKAKDLCSLKISEMLSTAYSLIIEAKKIGLDVLTVEVLYQKAEEALDLGRYDKAAKYASQSLHEIEEIRDESQRAANIIHLAGNYIHEAENINADVIEAKQLLEKAFSELKNNEYIASIELGKKCIRSAKNAKLIRVSLVLDSFHSTIAKSKNEGEDVSKAEQFLEEAKMALSDEDYSGAIRLAMMSESEVEKVELQKKMASEVISVTARKLKEAEAKGVIVEDVRKLLMKAASALKSNDYVKALEYGMESGMELSEATDVYERALTTIHAAQARMNESDDIGVDVNKAKELFNSANTAYNESDYSTAMRFAKEAIKEAKNSYDEFLSKPIANCEQLIKTAEELDVDVTRASNMLNEAKAALEEESYSQVLLFTDNCKRHVEKELSKHIYKKLSSAKAKYAKVKSKGTDLKEAMSMLKNLEKALDNKEYAGIEEHFKKFIDLIEVAETGTPKVETKPSADVITEKKMIIEEKGKKVPTELDVDLDEFIPALEEKMLRVSKQGINTKKADGLLKKAKKFMNKEPEKAYQLAQEAESTFEKELAALSPVISFEIDLDDIKGKDKWYEIPLVITNSGKSVAKNVSFILTGKGFDVGGFKTLKILKAKEKNEIPLKIMATDEGKLNFSLDITFVRIFDGKEFSIPFSQEVNIESSTPKKPLFTRVKTEKPMKCYACNGKIKPGSMMIKCDCGNTYHEPCANRKGKCQKCGVIFEKPAVAKKKLALRFDV